MMINMTNVVPVPEDSESLSLAVFILLVLLFAAFLLISVAFLCYACRHRRIAYEVLKLSSFRCCPAASVAEWLLHRLEQRKDRGLNPGSTICLRVGML